MTKQCVYRAKRTYGVILFISAVPFVAFGALDITGFGPQWNAVPGVILIGASALLVYGALSYFWMGFVVERQGLTESYLGWKRNTPWEIVEHWSVEDEEGMRCVRFKRINDTWPFDVLECYACRPSFDQFVLDIRGVAGEKERSPSQAVSQQTSPRLD